MISPAPSQLYSNSDAQNLQFDGTKQYKPASELDPVTGPPASATFEAINNRDLMGNIGVIGANDDYKASGVFHFDRSFKRI